MENKLVEFVREFNAHLEDTNQYCNLQYSNDGFTQAVTFPQLILFDNDNNSTEFAVQLSLACLRKTLSKVNTAVGELLADEIDKFFAEKRLKLKENFPKVKLKLSVVANCRWRVFVSGDYEESDMDIFMDVLKSDFEYIFDGLTLDTEW